MTAAVKLSYPVRIAAAVAAAVVSLPGVAHAATPDSVSLAYDASSEVIANPGRGFFTYTETHLYADGTGYQPLDAAALTQARLEQAHSLVYRIFYLERYRDTDAIAAADLDLVRADFAAARAAGVKLVVRFAYTATDDADAPVARVRKHITQLGPILTANADIVTAVQAGFVGRWGEWYYTSNFTRTDWADRKQVLSALLAATPAGTLIQVRTPQIKRKLFPGAGVQAARIGLHNDCFLAGDDDAGTYLSDDRAWLMKQSATTLVGGETCAVSERSGWVNASAEMAAYHWTYLNPSFDTEVLNSWGAEGLDEAARRLGYRIRLTQATLPVRATAGAKVSVRLTLTNDGYAAPAQNRPVRLVLTDGRTTQTVAVPADLRTWTTGRTVTLTASFRAPAAPGAYDLSLALPDPVARLQSEPAYAIRLANTGTWDAASGRNALGATLTVTR